MPLSRLEVEQTAQDRWVAEVEVGGISNYRITVRGNTFAQIMAECERAYYERRPDERPYNPLPSDLVPSLPAKRVLSDEHKRAMAEGRAKARAAKHTTITLEDGEDDGWSGPISMDGLAEFLKDDEGFDAA